MDDESVVELWLSSTACFFGTLLYRLFRSLKVSELTGTIVWVSLSSWSLRTLSSSPDCSKALISLSPVVLLVVWSLRFSISFSSFLSNEIAIHKFYFFIIKNRKRKRSIPNIDLLNVGRNGIELETSNFL